MSETFDEKVAVSLRVLKNDISRRDNNELKINTLLNNEAVEENEKANLYIWNDDMKKAEIKKNSPFLKYYENIFQHFQKTIMPIEKKDNNIFYSPDLFELIKNKMYLMPLWTGVMIKQASTVYNSSFLANKTRLSNNPVENWFGHLKTNLLKKKHKYSPNEYVLLMYKCIQAKYVRFYSEKSSANPNSNSEHKKDNKNIHDFDDKTEKWGSSKPTKRHKGYYTTPITNFGFFDDGFENESILLDHQLPNDVFNFPSEANISKSATK